MFVPRYWSEASHRESLPEGRQVTVRRFGWSSTSAADAATHARQRVEEAVAVLRAGGPDALHGFTRRERAVAYAGSDGLPIREEIVEERPEADVVVTRNGYGALCLNTRDAMFVDVDDVASHASGRFVVGALLGATLGAVVASVLPPVGWLHGTVGGAVVLGAVFALSGRLRDRRDPRRRDVVAWATDRTRDWCRTHPGWRVVVYETPAGARLLPVHASFDAARDETFEFMRFVDADPLYDRMCRLQKCFRARVSPKPWRAGIAEPFRAGGTWPVEDPGKLRVRSNWVRRYERVARGFASCRLVGTVGDGVPDARVERVRAIHDEMCQATRALALA